MEAKCSFARRRKRNTPLKAKPSYPPDKVPKRPPAKENGEANIAYAVYEAMRAKYLQRQSGAED